MKRTVSFFLVLLLAACGTDPEPTSGIELKALDRSVDPCDDFYQFACGGWSRAHPLNEDASYDMRFFDPFYDAVPRIHELIQESVDGTRDDDPHAALIGDYHASCLAAPSDVSSRDRLRALLARLEGLSTLEDLAREAAAQLDVGSGTFFRLGVGQDLDDATRHIAVLDQGGFELPDRGYYLDAEQEPVRSAYREHIRRVSELIGAPIDADAAIRVETALALASLPAADRRDPRELHHPLSADAVVSMAPAFPWRTFWDAAGFTDLQRIDVVVPAYVTALGALFEQTPIQDLEAYMRWQLLQDRSSGLDQAFIDEDFRFWSTLSGQTAQHPRGWTCFNTTLSTFGHELAQPYLARYADDDAQGDAEALFERLRDTLARRIRAARWLDEPTREQALAKLEQVVAKIGYPEDGMSYDGLVLDRSSFFESEIRLRRFARRRNVAQLGAPVDRDQWYISPLTSNAIYTPTLNDVTLPAILLAPPFLPTEGSDASRLGALGSVLGHELTHGFDDRGRQFDGTGALHDWWTPRVEREFTARAQCLEEQFSAYEPLPGEHVDGKLTLGENIADLGGVRVAYDALLDGSSDETGGDGFDARQVFFISFAQVFCENVRPELAARWLRTDPHSPGRFRINGSLANHEGFASAFGCSGESPMVRAEACSVW
jgi:putative endopeptidase